MTAPAFGDTMCIRNAGTDPRGQEAETSLRKAPHCGNINLDKIKKGIFNHASLRWDCETYLSRTLEGYFSFSLPPGDRTFLDAVLWLSMSDKQSLSVLLLYNLLLTSAPQVTLLQFRVSYKSTKPQGNGGNLWWHRTPFLKRQEHCA